MNIFVRFGKAFDLDRGFARKMLALQLLDTAAVFISLSKGYQPLVILFGIPGVLYVFFFATSHVMWILEKDRLNRK